jgi:hypothetical protein
LDYFKGKLEDIDENSRGKVGKEFIEAEVNELESYEEYRAFIVLV